MVVFEFKTQTAQTRSCTLTVVKMHFEKINKILVHALFIKLLLLALLRLLRVSS